MEKKLKWLFTILVHCPIWVTAQNFKSFNTAIDAMGVEMRRPKYFKEVPFKLSCNDGKLGNSIFYSIETDGKVKIGMSYVDLQAEFKKAIDNGETARVASLNSNYFITARMLADSINNDIIRYGVNQARKMYNADSVLEFSRNCPNLQGYNRVIIIAKNGIGHIELTYWASTKELVLQEINKTRKLLSFK